MEYLWRLTYVFLRAKDQSHSILIQRLRLPHAILCAQGHGVHPKQLTRSIRGHRHWKILACCLAAREATGEACGGYASREEGGPIEHASPEEGGYD